MKATIEDTVSIQGTNSPKSIAFNFITLTGSSFLIQVLGFITTIIIARNLGTEAFGTYNLFLYLISIFSVFGLVGMSPVLIREVARYPDEIHLYHRAGVLVRNVCTLASCILMVGFVVCFKANIATIEQCFIIAMLIWQAVIIDTQQSLFYGQQRMAISSVLNIFSRLLWVCIVFLFIYFREISVNNICIALILCQFIIIIGGRVYLKKSYITSLYGRINKSLIIKIINESWPFLVLAVLALFAGNIGKIMLSVFRNEEELAYFAVADKLQLPLCLAGVALANSLFPVLSIKYHENIQQFEDLSTRAMKYSVMLFLPICIIISINSREIVTLIFGPTFSQAIETLSIYIFNAVFMVCFLVIGTILAAMNRNRMIMILAAGAAIINSILFLALIKPYGSFGLALAFLFGNIINLGFHLYFTEKLLGGRSLVKSMVKPLIISFISCIPLLLKRWTDYIFLTFLCMVIFLILVFSTNVLDEEEKQFLYNVVLGGKTIESWVPVRKIAKCLKKRNIIE